MNKQKIFDMAIEHLHTQGGPSRADDGKNCMYRGPEGRKCVVGAFIPDEAYVREMDRSVGTGNSINVSTLIERYQSKLPDWFREHEELLSYLQLVHDDPDSHVHGTESVTWDSAHVRARLIKIAEKHDLNTAAVNRFFPENGNG